jgi:hypothetical protein
MINADIVTPREQTPMPRKVGTGKPGDAGGAERKAVRLMLPPETHKELRIEAARRDMSLPALVLVLVEDFLASRKKGAD